MATSARLLMLQLSLVVLVFTGAFVAADTGSFNGGGYYATFPTLVLPDAPTPIRLDFKTASAVGLLMYTGGLAGIDFLSLELQDANVVFRWNCGSGAGQLIVSGPFNDNQWHTIDASIHFRDASLTVDTRPTVSGSSPGALLSVNATGPLCVGGIPDDVTLQAGSTTATLFNGCLRNARVGSKGLLNFASAVTVNLADADMCTQHSNYLAKFETGSFVELPKLEIAHTSVFELEFRTNNGSGLLLYQPGLNGVDFVSLELINGRVSFQWNCGSGKGTVVSSSINNLKNKIWHRVVATLSGTEGELKIDNIFTSTGSSPGEATGLTTTRFAYIGGLPWDVVPHPDSISTSAFRGCIRNVVLPGVRGVVDFEQLAVSSAVAGYVCKSTCAIFDKNSFVAFPGARVDADGSSLRMTVSTRRDKALLAFQAGDDDSDWIAVAIDDGYVFAAYHRAEVEPMATVRSSNTVNDGLPHHVSVSWHNDLVVLVVDSSVGNATVASDTLPPFAPQGSLLLGGVPNHYEIPDSLTELAPSLTFEGSISEVALTGFAADRDFVTDATVRVLAADSCSETPRPPISFAFAGSAFLFHYYIGAMERLLELRLVDRSSTLFGGISGGAIISTATCSGVSLDELKVGFAEMYAGCHANIESCTGTLSPLAKRKFYDQMFDQAAYEKCGKGRVRVGYTLLNKLSTGFDDAKPAVAFSFVSAADLVEALLASSYLSCFVAPWVYTTFRGQPAIDGGYKADYNQICHPGTTCIKISAYVVGTNVTEGRPDPSWACIQRYQTTGALHNWPRLNSPEWTLPTDCEYDYEVFHTPTRPDIHPGKRTQVPYSQEQWQTLSICMGAEEDQTAELQLGRDDVDAWYEQSYLTYSGAYWELGTLEL
ncbi:hypothetical protein CAOG_07351 [Capsaspora owczarzaki ATCC 30864]|uniref:Laminin G domain-containing protein n=1 Tax=Capsaspora owczarzaki (strain ATCC 30864) TaxID=595528 RepID=A0A0D2WXK5_CAPO3|nr:hypothetical protein CAOG_07351 [Capsaspora owczarzaki ATCC 30864]KJE97503.1 hypothetical protein CAOG_007351 [Capsaspora owczarzaki ATCC 30864]|eukprot:XP_004343210.1 hypothetical protein CAOG_07351 [Capsaspora owczarzaki ATCC 30864]